jgi:hypothetical protein
MNYSTYFGKNKGLRKKVGSFFAGLFLFGLGLAQAQQTYGDTFATREYDRNDGTTNWATDWIESGDTNNGPTAEYIQIQGGELYMYWLWAEDIRRTADLTGATSATLSFDYTSSSLGGTRQLGVYLSNDGGASFVPIATLSGNGSFSQDISAYIAANTVIRFAKSNANWNSDDNAFIDNVLLSAVVPVPLADTDGDGIPDITDLDNDNDGILDKDECAFIPTVTQSFTSSGGTTITNTAANGRGNLIIDFISIDNSFNLTINGTDIATEFQFQPGAPGNFARFDTGFTYGQNGVPQLWSITGTAANPILRVFIDADGNLELFGAQSSGGTLVTLTLDTPPTTVPWNPTGNNTISIGQFVTGPTNMNGELRFSEECDTDLDGILNRFDLDSDNDGIYDAVEAGHGQTHTNGILLGAVGTDGVPNSVQTNPNSKAVNYVLQDSDGDTISDTTELDSDNDGCTDVLEAGYTQSGTVTGELQGTGYNSNNGLVTGNGDGYTLPNNLNGDGTFDFQQGIVPVITGEPTTATICTSCTGNLSVVATDTDTYQWQIFDGSVWSNVIASSIYSGTTSSTLVITNPPVGISGTQFRVLASNTANICTERISNTAILNVNVPTIITNRRITYRINKN